MDTCDFGRRLVVIRLSHGMTQAELADRAGLSVRCISDLERGINAAPRVDTLQLLIAGLGLDPETAAELRSVAACARVRLRFGEAAVDAAMRRGRRATAVVHPALR